MDRFSRTFTAVAGAVSAWTGRPAAFLGCCLIVVVWAAAGPAAHYSDTWQLIINTGTTVITFLMVFLIQNTQNRDNAAVQAKLDELIRASKAKNEFIGIEHLTDAELTEILTQCERHRPNLVKKAEAAASSKTKRSRAAAQAKAARKVAKTPSKSGPRPRAA